MKEIDRLAGYLKGRDAPCPGCGYNLRDLIGERCPECGEALTVVKIIYHAPKASLASVVVGFFGLVGGAAVLASVWPVMMQRPRRRRGDFTIWDVKHLVLIGLTLGLTVLFAVWYDWHDEMRRRPARFRWGWAAACYLTAPLAWLVGRLMGRW